MKTTSRWPMMLAALGLGVSLMTAAQADSSPVASPVIATEVAVEAASATNTDAKPAPTLDGPVQQQLLSASTPEATHGISAHEPVYFIFNDNWLGKSDYGAKFQISLRYQLFNSATPKAPTWQEHLYFAYTQTSIWDMKAASKPFHDSAYRPELFWDDPDFSAFPAITALAGMRAGVGHESNGRDGEESRSINIVYVRPTFTFLGGEDYVWSFSPKIYAYLNKSDNPDIDDYRGYADLLLRLKKDDTWEYDLTLRKGTKDAYGSMQFDVSYPFRGFLHSLNGYLYFQYFNGYGETILDYNIKEPSRIGLGLMLVR